MTRINEEELKPNIDILYGKLNRAYSGAYSALLEPTRGKAVDVLVATILSQATNDIVSSRAFAQLKSECPEWGSIFDCPVSLIEKALSCGGLYREKTQKILGALGKIKDDFGEITLDPLLNWPSKKAFEYLTSLPGVGPKTAACVLAFGLDKPAFPVDTHIHRIARRLGYAAEKQSAVQVQEMFEKAVPDNLKMELHIMLIEHGRRICTSRKPKCEDCLLRDDCRYFKDNDCAGVC